MCTGVHGGQRRTSDLELEVQVDPNNYIEPPDVGDGSEIRSSGCVPISLASVYLCVPMF